MSGSLIDSTAPPTAQTSLGAAGLLGYRSSRSTRNRWDLAAGTQRTNGDKEEEQERPAGKKAERKGRAERGRAERHRHEIEGEARQGGRRERGTVAHRS